MVLFTGSDWCPWCIKLREKVLSRSKFQEFAEKELILVFVDSPRGFELPHKVKRRHEKLRKELGAGSGVPHAIFVSPEGDKLGEIIGYHKQSEYLQELVNILKQARFPRRGHR